MGNKSMNISCLKHPSYSPPDKPNLYCKQCCTIYVQWVKECGTIEFKPVAEIKYEKGKLKGSVRAPEARTFQSINELIRGEGDE